MDVLQIKKEIAYSIIDGEAYIATLADNCLHHLNGLGSVIWRLLEKKTNMNGIVAEICKEYEVDENTVRQDVLDFLNELKNKKVIEFDVDSR